MSKNIFHVHTKRCRHAIGEDEEYIKRAIELGAQSITFTDHAPFPGDPFRNRMKYKELNGYVQSLNTLKNKYKNEIDVQIGLEIEFLPYYIEYYKKLRNSGNFDILILGQHFFEIRAGQYVFPSLSKENRDRFADGCGKAIIEGVNTGLFDVVAHPDRIFKYKTSWNAEMEDMTKKIVDAAKMYNVLLEQNESSKHKNHYWDEFWDFVPEELVIKGLDAHSVKELKIL